MIGSAMAPGLMKASRFATTLAPSGIVKPSVSQPIPKTFEDVRSAFETRNVLRSSDQELQELLVAVGAENIPDPIIRARAAEMSETMRQLLQSRRIEALRPQRSKAAVVALIFSAAALLFSGAQAYRSWSPYSVGDGSASRADDFGSAAAQEENEPDGRTHLTVSELAKRAPSLRTGTLQAWWAGEQARQIQKLEAQARRQVLAGDADGAARSVSRADAIRSRVPSLVGFEKPMQK